MSDDIGADSTLEREIAPILSIGDAFPKILITRTRHEPHTREGVLVLNFARWLLMQQSIVLDNEVYTLANILTEPGSCEAVVSIRPSKMSL